MKALQAELERLYAGVDFNQVEAEAPRCVCDVCQDTGFIRYDVGIDDSRFGKMYPCPNPDCPTRRRQVIERVERFKASSDWEEAYTGWTFDSFYEATQARAAGQDAMHQKRAAYAAARYFAEHVGTAFTMAEATLEYWKARYTGKNADRAANSVVLRGDVGLGKTGLAIAAVNVARAAGHAVVFARVQSIIRRIQDTYKDSSNELLDDVLRFYAEAPVLVIDEFGLEQYAADRLEKFEEILRARDRKNLPFLLTTNLTIDELYTLWHPRIADIVAKAHWMPIGGVKLRDTTSEEEVLW